MQLHKTHHDLLPDTISFILKLVLFGYNLFYLSVTLIGTLVSLPSSPRQISKNEFHYRQVRLTSNSTGIPIWGVEAATSPLSSLTCLVGNSEPLRSIRRWRELSSHLLSI
jgi:hypothetical protein